MSLSPLDSLAAAAEENRWFPNTPRLALVRAHFGLRIAAAAIDVAVIFILSWSGCIVPLWLGWDASSRIDALGDWFFFGWMGFIALGYTAFLEGIVGISFGKAGLNLRIEPTGDMRCRRRKLLVRWSCKSIPLIMSTLLCLLAFVHTARQDDDTFAVHPWRIDMIWPLVLSPFALLVGAFLPRVFLRKPALYDALAQTDVFKKIPTPKVRGFPVLPASTAAAERGQGTTPPETV